MVIQLMITNDPPNKLNKTTTEVENVEISLKDDTNIMRPVIRLSPGYFSKNFNYAYIPAFGRYYFINGKGVNIGKLVEYTLDIDVLMSWKTAINSSRVIASRSTNNGNKLLPDRIPVLAKRNVIYKALKGGAHDIGAFGSEFTSANGYHYLLTVLNGAHETAGASTLTLVSVSGATVELTWTAITGVDTYWLYRKAPGALDFEIIERNPVITSYTDTVTAAGEYLYKIRGVIDGQPGEDSNIVTANVEEV